eukprot:CAMPEP_0174732106 /NCGR_PEP_ID=MMETSP1094-20130205/58812_1 /TAXON_ID=156173 /ORGANISM="Chrysochromulina brevifilum, Strain UTEX LB 985" /LENGTH=83 /DNA_ID=CAMNT_0015934581 /DNA_START=21 /DNA_END=272 /DNA_ORIENTATION=+
MEIDAATFRSFDTNGDGKVSLKEFDENLHDKTREKLEEALQGGFVFDKEKWEASLERHSVLDAQQSAAATKVQSLQRGKNARR